jgi:hypothetical protein
VLSRFPKEAARACEYSAKALEVAVGQEGGLYFVRIDRRVDKCGWAPGAAQKVRQDTTHERQRLSVWALADTALRAPWMLQQEKGVSGCVLQVSAPAATNANLHAQQGLFSLNRPAAMDLDAPVDRRPLDVLLAETLAMFQGRKVLWQFTLEKRHAPELLRLLALEGTSAAKLFPGFGGIALALQEEQLWDLRGCPPHA